VHPVSPPNSTPPQKISLPAVVLEEKTSVANIVTAEQQHVLDAIAVRNMKTRKTMTHQV
jgi:hypothetical protein